MIGVFMKGVLFLVFVHAVSVGYGTEKYKKIKIEKGITLKLPEDFVVMSDDDMAQKYPTYKKPLCMYTSANKQADFGINFAANKWNNQNLNVLEKLYKASISSMFNEVKFIQDGNFKKVNGRDFILFEFISTLIDDKTINEKNTSVMKYTYLGYTLYENKILIFNFTTAARYKAQWDTTASVIMNSIKISSTLKIDNYKPFEVNRPLPNTNGKNDPQMEAIKKLRKRNENLK